MGILVQGTVLTFPRTSNSSNKCNATSAICPLLHAVMQAFHVTSKKTKTQIIKMFCPESFRIWYKVYIQMQYIHITSVDMNNFLMMWFALHAAFTFMPPWLFIEVRGHPAFVSTHFQWKLFQPSWQNNKNSICPSFRQETASCDTSCCRMCRNNTKACCHFSRKLQALMVVLKETFRLQVSLTGCAWLHIQFLGRLRRLPGV